MIQILFLCYFHEIQTCCISMWPLLHMHVTVPSWARLLKRGLTPRLPHPVGFSSVMLFGSRLTIVLRRPRCPQPSKYEWVGGQCGLVWQASVQAVPQSHPLCGLPGRPHWQSSFHWRWPQVILVTIYVTTSHTSQPDYLQCSGHNTRPPGWTGLYKSLCHLKSSNWCKQECLGTWQHIW